MGLIIWDIEKEKERNSKNASKIIKEFPELKDLPFVLDQILRLMDLEIYEKIFEATNLKDEIGEERSIEFLLERYDQIKLATRVLSNPPIYIPLFTDTIISSHFLSTISLVGFTRYAYSQKKTTIEDLDLEFQIFERIMVLLDDFDKPSNSKTPDINFYKKLKGIKWDKTGKTLFEKIRDILYHIREVKWGWSASKFGNGEYFLIIFLSACSAVHHDRNKIMPEDVVIAYKTYIKLINTDISKLEVL